MYRLMQPSDEAAVLALWQSQHHDTEDFAKMVLERFAGVQNIYVADENDAIVAAALAVPVTLQGRTGNYLCLCGEGSLLLAGLLDTLCAHQKLWSQAEFDTVTAKKLCELREQFWKDTVQLSPERMAVVLQELYARGATIVSNEHGYGIYFRKEDTLYFVEMMADSDRAAEILMEAAREKEVIVEKAVITVGAAQPLFLGEGTRQEYGMIRFDAEPFDVSESYLRLMLEN